MARAEAFAARCRERREVEATEPVAALNTFDPELQQRRHLAEWRELNKAYLAYLTGLLDAAESDRDRWRDACAAQEDACAAQEKELAVHRARSRTFAALERIWRQTYRRLSGLFDRLHLS